MYIVVEFIPDITDVFNYLPPFRTLSLRINNALYGYVDVIWIPNSFSDYHTKLVLTADITWHLYRRCNEYTCNHLRIDTN